MQAAEKWSKEPDLERLGAAYRNLNNGSPQAIMELRGLVAAGSVMSMIYLGSAYTKGLGTSVDLGKAEEYYRSACETGSNDGLFALAGHYYRLKNFQRAEELLREGASRDHLPSIYWLGRLLLRSSDAAREAEAIILLKRAIERGHVYAGALLGKLLMSGRYGFFARFRGFSLRVKSAVVGSKIVMEEPWDERVL